MQPNSKQPEGNTKAKKQVQPPKKLTVISQFSKVSDPLRFAVFSLKVNIGSANSLQIHNTAFVSVWRPALC